MGIGRQAFCQQVSAFCMIARHVFDSSWVVSYLMKGFKKRIRKLNEMFFLAINAATFNSALTVLLFVTLAKDVIGWFSSAVLEHLICSPVFVWPINSDFPGTRTLSQSEQYALPSWCFDLVWPKFPLRSIGFLFWHVLIVLQIFGNWEVFCLI